MTTYDELGHRGQISTAFNFLIKRVATMAIMAIPVSSDPSVLAFASLEWDKSIRDPYLDYFDSLFVSQIDPTTLELFDAEEAFHPFCFAAKVQSEDYPSYQEILRMPV